MGCYISPSQETKESFLAREGRVINVNDFTAEPNELPVCLVDNGAFNAAAVAFDRAELHRFSDVNDQRPKVWYLVPIDKLAEVSDVIHYIK